MSAIQRLRDLMAQIGVWRRRSHERWALAAMSNRALQDIGITRWDARREINKPCWRA